MQAQAHLLSRQNCDGSITTAETRGRPLAIRLFVTPRQLGYGPIAPGKIGKGHAMNVPLLSYGHILRESQVFHLEEEEQGGGSAHVLSILPSGQAGWLVELLICKRT